MQKRQKVRSEFLPIAGKVLGFTILVIVMFPLIWTISFSLRPEAQQFSGIILSLQFTIENFVNAMYPAFLGYIANSVIVSLTTGVVALTVAVFAAYAFSRLNFAGKKILFVIIIMSQLVPIATIVLPMYRIIQAFGLINTRIGLIVAYLSFTTPVSVWIMKGFFDNIPKDLEEAAIIDGCSHATAFVRVILPISTPGLVATFIWLIIATWQELVYALTLVTRANARTVSVGIFDFFDQYTIDYGTLFAGSILISLPIVLAFLFLQRYFVAGLAEGAVKG
jgi:multiple sugar transport system permease protein/raffinose/stachyose/melibiose transport system permease protein